MTRKGDRLPELAEDLLSAFNSTETTIRALTQLRLPPRVSAHIAVVLARYDPNDRLRRQGLPFANLRLLNHRDEDSLYRVEFHDNHLRGRHALAVRLSRIPGTPVMLLTTLASGAQWRLGAQRMIDALYPWVFRPFLRQWELRSIFETMQQSLRNQRELRFTRVSSVRRLLHTPSRKRYESGLVWTDVDFVDAFREADENLIYFKRIGLAPAAPLRLERNSRRGALRTMDSAHGRSLG